MKISNSVTDIARFARLECKTKDWKMEMWTKEQHRVRSLLMLIGAHKVKQAPPRSHDL